MIIDVLTLSNEGSIETTVSQRVLDMYPSEHLDVGTVLVLENVCFLSTVRNPIGITLE